MLTQATGKATGDAAVIRSEDDLIHLLEADAACLAGVRLTDIDLVTSALRVVLIDGRRFEVAAIEMLTDDDQPDASGDH